MPWRWQFLTPSGALFETYEWFSEAWVLVVTGVDAVGYSSAADVSWTFGLQVNGQPTAGIIDTDRAVPVSTVQGLSFSWRGAMPLHFADVLTVAVDGDEGNTVTLWGYLVPLIDIGAAWQPV